MKDELVTQPGSVLQAERLTFAHSGCVNIIPRPKADRHKEANNFRQFKRHAYAGASQAMCL